MIDSRWRESNDGRWTMVQPDMVGGDDGNVGCEQMDPWNKETVGTKVQDFAKLLIWVFLTVNVIMFSILTMPLTYEFLTHSYRWAMRTSFSQEW